VPERWTSFSCKIADRDARVYVSQDARENPDPSRGTLMFAKFGVLDPDGNGLSKESEDEDLEDLRNVARKVIEIRLQATFVGTITTAGRYEMYFYGANAGGLEGAAEEALVDFEEYKVELGSSADPDWKHVRDVMNPAAGGT
jgi:hypothetical protein